MLIMAKPNETIEITYNFYYQCRVPRQRANGNRTFITNSISISETKLNAPDIEWPIVIANILGTLFARPLSDNKCIQITHTHIFIRAIFP